MQAAVAGPEQESTGWNSMVGLSGTVLSVPQHGNAVDCGVFMLENLRRVLWGEVDPRKKEQEGWCTQAEVAGSRRAYATLMERLQEQVESSGCNDVGQMLQRDEELGRSLRKVLETGSQDRPARQQPQGWGPGPSAGGGPLPRSESDARAGGPAGPKAAGEGPEPLAGSEPPLRSKGGAKQEQARGTRPPSDRRSHESSHWREERGWPHMRPVLPQGRAVIKNEKDKWGEAKARWDEGATTGRAR